MMDNYNIFTTQSSRVEHTLKMSISDIEDKSKDLESFIRKNQTISREHVNSDCWWEYLNPESNKIYYNTGFFTTFESEDYNIFSCILKYTLESCKRFKPNKNEINIAIVGGGNFCELKHVNYCAKNMAIGKRVNVDVIDAAIWPINKYKLEDTKYINRIKIILTDFFEELKKRNYYDAIIFSRSTNWAEYNRYEKKWERIDYFRNFTRLVKPYIENKTNIVLIDFNYDNSEAKSNTVDFAKAFFNYLDKAFVVKNNCKFKSKCTFLTGIKNNSTKIYNSPKFVERDVVDDDLPF